MTDLAYRDFVSKRFFASLDGIRCFCILAVIWHHSASPDIPLYIDDRGFLGVDMFFVLSGFLITTLLIRERWAYGKISLKAFWARRSLRIFPIYYLSLAGLTVLGLAGFMSSELRDSFFDALPFNLLYLTNWIHEPGPNLGPLWSLATEEQFYLVWPLVERFACKRIRWIFYGFLLGLSQLTNFGVIYSFLPEHSAEYLRGLEVMQSTFTPILLGVGLAHIMHSERGFLLIQRLAGHRVSPLFMAAALLLACGWPVENISGLPRLTIQIAMSGLIASCVVREDHFARPVLSFPPIRYLGAISYGMYLYHMWALHIAHETIGNRFMDEQWAMVAFPLAFLVTTVIASASFYAIEKPILKVKRRFSRVSSKDLSEPRSDDSERGAVVNDPSTDELHTQSSRDSHV